MTNLLALLLLVAGESRIYHGVSVADLKTTKWTHVSVCGRVTLVKAEADGDTHIRIDDGPAFIVAEIMPYKPLPAPKVGQFVRVAGISREDKTHGWHEVHPVEAITIVGGCSNTRRVQP